MRFTLFFLLLAALLGLAWAQTAQVPVIVSYSDDTPQSVIDEAMEAITKAVRSTSPFRMIRGAY